MSLELYSGDFMALAVNVYVRVAPKAPKPFLPDWECLPNQWCGITMTTDGGYAVKLRKAGERLQKVNRPVFLLEVLSSVFEELKR